MASEDQLIRDLKKAEARYQRASDDMRAATAARTEAFRRAAAEGMSRRRIAAIVDVHFSRVQQIIRAGND
jgi:hypothetical protein